MTTPASHMGITLRQAALTAGIGLLLMSFAPYAEFHVYPTLVIPGDIAQTVQNIAADEGLFLTGIVCYLFVFTCDLVVAWALYVLLLPVNRALSLLTAWFRIVYTTIAFVGLFKWVTAYRLIDASYFRDTFGAEQLQAQVYLLLYAYRYEWNMGLLLFGFHLLLVGYLVYRSAYIPRLVGICVAIAGLGWVVNALGHYLAPNVDYGFLMITFFGELVFMLWLLIRGWKIPEPA